MLFKVAVEAMVVATMVTVPKGATTTEGTTVAMVSLFPVGCTPCEVLLLEI